MKEICCPYCASNHCDKEYDLKWKDERFATYHVARCKECDSGFVLPLPTPEELNDLYNSLNYQSEDRSTLDFTSASEEQINAKIKDDGHFVKNYGAHVPASGHVLDIGAGWGTLLKSFANRGYRATGLELSNLTSEFARNKLGLEIHNLPVERIDELPDQTYDLITMRHVLEHFYQPIDVLTSLRETMGDQSKLIVEVPDYGSYDRKSYGESWPAFGPYHLWYFSLASLQRLLSDAGFEILMFHTFMSDRILNGPSFFQRFSRRALNRLGGRQLFSGRSIGLIARKKRGQ